MKKFLSYLPLSAAALIALSFAACTDSESIADGVNSVNTSSVPEGSVQFSTYMGKNAQETRAGSLGVINTDVLKLSDYGFGVMAYNTGTGTWSSAGTSTTPNFMFNEKITWKAEDNAWTYSPVKFWPNNSASNVDETGATNSANKNYLSFFAYAPYVTISSYGETAQVDVKIDETGSEDAANKRKAFVPADVSKGIVAITHNDWAGDALVKYKLVDAASTNAVDLLWGMRGNTAGYDLANGATETAIGAYNTDLTKQTVNEKVNFLFKHALAKIGGHTSKTSNTYGNTAVTGLQVVLDIDDGSYDGGVKNATAITGGEKEKYTLVTVKSVKIRDMYTYTHETATPDDDEKSDLANGGWFDIATGTWSNVYNNAVEATEASNVTYNPGEAKANTSGVAGTLNKDIAEPAEPASPTVQYASATEKWSLDGGTSNLEGVTTTPKDVYTEDSDVPAVFMIPSTADQTLVVTIDYTVRTYDEKLKNTYTEINQVITNSVTIPGNSLEVNKYYKLLMHLGLTSVKFTASVADWEEAGNTDSDDDGNIDNDDADADKDIYLPSNTLSRDLAGVEDADANVNIQAANPSVNIPSSETSYKIALLNIPASGEAHTISAEPISGGNVSAATITNNGVLNLTLNANTAAEEKVSQVKVTIDGTEYTITINQTMEMVVTSPKNISLGATTTVDLATITVNTTAVTDGLSIGTVKDEANNTVTGFSITGTTLTVPANTTSKIKTYTVPVTYTKDAKTVTENVIVTHGAGVVTVDYSPTAATTTTTKLSAGNERTITATVKDAAATPNTIDLTASTNTSTITVKNTTVSDVDVTAGCVITKTATGFTVQVPANSQSTDQKYKIYVKVNDAAVVESGEFTQAAAN